MLDGASEAVFNGQPCNWSPCCASEVFFAAKPCVDIGLFGQKPQIVKPFVLAAERAGKQDLLIRMSIFGLATEWSFPASQALITALRAQVSWRKLSSGQFFIPKHIEIGNAIVRQGSIGKMEKISNDCILSFSSPLDTERTDITFAPQRVIQKLLTRVALICRWHGAKLDVDLQALYDNSRSLEMSISGPVHTHKVKTGSGRGKQWGFQEVSLFDLNISGDLSLLWPYLCIGEVSHIGRGAVKGFGRYNLLNN
ncbi:MAG: CRISPR system precrRNA processing endoribonuclease RAMP protein Cas6 [Cohaesibacter sp.]|nr:CRISPR system precrRNA processing endoribonuclease RAMP protein Cas6 [Cohaesibacter sp.]